MHLERPSIPSHRPTARAALAKGRVLVVDDEATVLRAYGRILTAGGFDVVTAADGMRASELVEADRFDVIVSDLRMPGLDGLSLLRAVRHVDPDVPVVVTTGDPTSDSMDAAAEGGALVYLSKPVEQRALVQVVASAQRTGAAARRRRRRLGGAPAATLDQAIGDLAELATAFKRALGSLSMVYQPIVDVRAGAVFGYEALVRSDEPALAPSGVMLRAAERLGRTRELGRALRERVALAAASMPGDARLFVKLHPSDLADDALYSPTAPLSRIADRVVLEITERAPLGDVYDLAGRVAALRALGFRIAIDDLGSGYAGLMAVADLRPEVVKIDVGFARGVLHDPVQRKIVGSVVALCRDMGIALVAEGVDSKAERDALSALGCDLVQGYLFGPPQQAFAPSCLAR